MTHKVIVLGMLITLHSLGVLIASLVTYEWYVDNDREVGIFGVCETVNSTTMISFVNTFNEKLSNLTGNNKSRIDYLDKSIYDTNDRVYKKCFQLLWPNTEAAFEYLATKPVYLTAMMGVAISSASMGLLTFIWSFICIIFKNVGSHPRGGELLLILSIITDVSIISSFCLFMAKDDHFYSFKYFGLSFWLSVGSACGFFLTSVLFAANRINIGFKYMLHNYQSRFAES